MARGEEARRRAGERLPAAPHRFYVILLDRRTKPIQEKVRKLIAGKDRFVLGVAQEEIEAWWLGDRENVLAWMGFEEAPVDSRYARAGYRAEQDDAPKRTLDELTRCSERLDRVYGEGNLDLARDFAEHWEGHVRLPQIEHECPKRFPKLCRDSENAFRWAKSQE